MRNSGRYFSEVKDALHRNDLISAIWLLENGLEAVGGQEGGSALFPLADEIRRSSLDTAVAEARAGVDHAIRMLAHPHGMAGEEWDLIVTNLSTAYCLERFLRRFDLQGESTNLGAAMDLLAEMMEGLSSRDLQASIRRVRRHYPNPLPPPL